jgi:ubiquinone biosynthesis protein COQ4
MIAPLAAIKGILAFTTIVRDPDQLGKVFEMRESLTKPKYIEPMLADFRATEHGREALRLLRRLPTLDLDGLLALPVGSLGRVYAMHMREAGLDPAAIPTLPAHNEFEYVSAHLYETHDLWHALTGFGTDVAGELGLQAFYLRQFHGPLPFAILSAGLLNTMMFAANERDQRMDAIVHGWQLAKDVPSLFGIDWEALLPEPLEDVRRRYGIVVDQVPQPASGPGPMQRVTPGQSIAV